MRIIFQILVALFITTSFVSVPADAQSVPQTSTADMQNRVAEFKSLMGQNRIQDMIDYMPPKMKLALLEDSGVSETEMKNAMKLVWAQTLQIVKLESFEVDVNVPVKTLPTGGKYALLPTVTYMSLLSEPDMLVTATSETLALTDGGLWYMVRLDEAPQVQMFKSAYPEYANIDVMKPQMTTSNRGGN